MMIYSRAVARLQERIAGLEKAIVQLQEENTRLKERLGLNSTNSSKPPSTDQRKNKQRPKGGALKGHQGHFRTLSDRVDQRVTSRISQCQ